MAPARRGPSAAALAFAAALAACISAGCGAITFGVAVGVKSALEGGGGSPPPANAPPQATVTAPPGPFTDLVEVEVVLVDAEGDAADIEVAWSDGGAPATATATEARVRGSGGTRGLAASPAGVAHRFVWSSFKDLRGRDALSARLRVLPRPAGEARAGRAGETAPFAVLGSRVSTVLATERLAGLQGAQALAFTPDGRLAIADGASFAVFAFDPRTGLTARIAGTGLAGFDPDDLPGPESRLSSPVALAADAGAVYVADPFTGGGEDESGASGPRVLRIDAATGLTTRFAGGGGGTPPETFFEVLATGAVLEVAGVAAHPSSPLVYVRQPSGRIVAVNAGADIFDPGSASLGSIRPAYTRALPAPTSATAESIAVGPDGLLYLAGRVTVDDGSGPVATSTRHVTCFNPSPTAVAVRTVTTAAEPVVSVAPGAYATVFRIEVPEESSEARLAVGPLGELALLESIPGSGAARLTLANRGDAPRALSATATLAPGETAAVPLPAEPASPGAIAFEAGGALILGDGAGRVAALNLGAVERAVLGIVLPPGAAARVPVTADAAATELTAPAALAAGALGELYAVDASPGTPLAARVSRIVRIDPGTGRFETVAGAGAPGFAGDGGPAAAARLALPEDVAVGAGGRLLVADTGNGRVRVVEGGTIRTLAFGLDDPISVVEDERGVVYVGERGAGRVTALEGAGRRTVAGGLAAPRVAVDEAGVLYVAEQGAGARLLALNDRAATASVAGAALAPGAARELVPPGALGPRLEISAGRGLVLCADARRSVVRAVNIGAGPRGVGTVTVASGALATIAGTGAPAFDGDPRPALAAALGAPAGVVLDGRGRIAFAEEGARIVRLLNPGPAPIVAAGREIGPGAVGILAGAPGAGTRFGEIIGAAVDGAGSVYVTTIKGTTPLTGDIPEGNVAFRLDLGSRALVRLFGGAPAPVTAPSPLGETFLGLPVSLALDPERPLVVVADGLSPPPAAEQAIRCANLGAADIQAYGVTIPAGGVAPLTDFSGFAVARGADGSLYIPDRERRVVRLYPDGTKAVVVTTTSAGAFDFGLGGVAVREEPGATTVYVSDLGRGRIVRRRFTEAELADPGFDAAAFEDFIFDPAVARPTAPFSSLPTPREATRLSGAIGLALDPDGNLYMAELSANRILCANVGTSTITVAGTEIGPGLVAQIAGADDFRAGYNGEAVPARNALLDGPAFIAIDPDRNLFVTEANAARLRRFSLR